MQLLEHSSTTQTTTNVSSVTSIEGTNSVQKNAATATTANVINDAEQLRLQQQVALANFQMLQYICSQINGAGGAAASWWPCALPVGEKNLIWLRPPNGFHLQGLPEPGLQGIQDQRSQAQKIFSNAERLQNHALNPNLLAAGAVSTTNHQHILPLRPSQIVHAGAQINTHQLQQYPKYSKKSHAVATATNPATVSSHDQHSHVTEYGIPTPAIIATSTTAISTESLSSNSDLNNPRKRRRDAYNRSNCRDLDKSNSESKENLPICPVPGCTIRFSRNFELQAHIQSHTSLPFSPTFCGKTLNRFGDLNTHQRSHTAQELQRYPNDSNKGEVVATATNPETENTPYQHSQVTEFDNPSSAITTTSTTATSTKSQSSNSELNYSNKGEVAATATNPETESTSNQHSQITEFDNPSSAITTTSTTATSTKSQLSNSELNYSNKGEVAATATNPETESTPNQHSQITEFDNPSSAITTTSTTATSTKSQSSNSELNYSNKGEVAATATNPETESTPNQHSQITEIDNPSSAIATTSTTATTTKSLSSNSKLNVLGRRQTCTCAICINPVKRNSESKQRLFLEQRLYICNFPGCTLLFSRRSNLRTHIRKHIAECPFCCTSCGKACISSDDLCRHQMIHTDEYIFKCTECIKRFNRRDLLSQHLKTHHSKSTLQLPTS